MINDQQEILGVLFSTRPV